jgi:hypothetical protein
VLSVQIKLLGG